MSRLVVDSSIVIKWFVPEIGSDVADQVLDRYKIKSLTLLAPDLLHAELGNIVWKKCRLQTLEPDDGHTIIYAMKLIELEVTPSSQLLNDAYRLATDHQRTVYDSLYIALSLREGVPFLTADEKLVRAVSHTIPNVYSLNDWHQLGANL